MPGSLHFVLMTSFLLYISSFQIPRAKTFRCDLNMAGFGKPVPNPTSIKKDFPNPTDLCACGSSKSYSDCCLKYHSDSRIPMEPEDLVRARFSAFVYSKIDFLLESTHPDSKYFEVDEVALGSKRTKRQIWFKQLQSRADEMDFSNLKFILPTNIDDKLKTFLQEKGYLDKEGSISKDVSEDGTASVLIALDRKPKSAIKFDKVLEKIIAKKAANGGYLYIGAGTEILDQKNPQQQKVTYKGLR